MRIAIDARMMGAGKTRGIGRYIYETVEAMRPLADRHELVLLQPPIKWYTVEEQQKMPDIFKDAKPDLVWVPHWNAPIFYKGPLAITIHDLLLLHQPASAKASTKGPIVAWMKRLGFRMVLRNAVRHASVILVPTKAVAEDVASFFPKAKSKIVVTGEGLTPLQASGKRLVEGDYIFYFGSAYPHKRIDLILEAWKTISKTHPELSLVIGGERDVFMKRHEAFVAAEHLPRVLFPGALSDQDLADYLAGAKVHVHSANFEGFGLPPLEALSQGTPTVVADIPVLREVLPKEGVTFFKSGAADAMMAAIETVLAQGDAARAAARRGGDEARRRHDWNDVARRTLDALCHAQPLKN